MKFIAAKWFTATDGREIRWLVLHVPQFPERFGAAVSLGNYFKRGERKASTHYVVDDVEIVQCVKDKDVAYGAASANKHGLHWEMVGFAEQTPEQWDDDYSDKVIERTASHVGQKAAEYRIPIRFVDAEGLKRGEWGITTHYEVNRAWPSTGHTDPGRHFPIRKFLALAAMEEDDMFGDPDRDRLARIEAIVAKLDDNENLRLTGLKNDLTAEIQAVGRGLLERLTNVMVAIRRQPWWDATKDEPGGG